MNKPKVALYCRVSTSQKADKQDPTTQLRVILKHALRAGWQVNGEHVFVDWCSGTKTSRPQLDELFRAARSHEFEKVVVWRFDRFGRSTIHLINSEAELRALGIDFVSCTQGIDTSTPEGRLFFQIGAAFAEFERALIVERVQAGVDRVKENGGIGRSGRHIGRPRARFDRVRALELSDKGLSTRAIARRFKVSQSVVARELKTIRTTKAAA
jgi:DNA invertase Pin-like site-specific DNA recombinase